MDNLPSSSKLNELSIDRLTSLSDDDIRKSVVDCLGIDSFYFNSETALKGDLDKFEEILTDMNFVKLFGLDSIKNKNYDIPTELKNKIYKLKVENSVKSTYSYVFNIYLPGEGIYTFYFNPSLNNSSVDNRVYKNFIGYMTDIKKFLASRKDDEYFISVFSSNLGSGKGPNYNELVIANNVYYEVPKVA